MLVVQVCAFGLNCFHFGNSCFPSQFSAGVDVLQMSGDGWDGITWGRCPRSPSSSHADQGRVAEWTAFPHLEFFAAVMALAPVSDLRIPKARVEAQVGETQVEEQQMPDRPRRACGNDAGSLRLGDRFACRIAGARLRSR
jgi:hypothetical protein